MKLRIAIWASVGALIVVLWSVYIAVTKPSPLGMMWFLTDLTCPLALARHHRLSVYFVLLMNAAAYALIGTIFETIRRYCKQTCVISS